MTAFAPLDRLFDPEHPCFTVEGAKILTELREDEFSTMKMQELAHKAGTGTLTDAESREYESWVRAGSLISILQAKARLYLKKIAGQ